MPIYEYRCTRCDASFEKLVFSGEEQDIECPECGSREVEKKMSAASFLGSGSSSCAPQRQTGFS